MPIGIRKAIYLSTQKPAYTAAPNANSNWNASPLYCSKDACLFTGIIRN